MLKILNLKTKWVPALISILCLYLPSGSLLAGGGLVLEGDTCIIRIDFYSAHFTAYQPDTRGNEQFCRDLPDTGLTIFVLDYLHQSLKEVPVDFRIIKNVTGLGRFAKLKNVMEIEDIEQHTVFYQSPIIRPDASFKVEYEFTGKGEYIGIVTAGHPSRDTIYTAIFPFEVGAPNYANWFMLIVLLGAAAVFVFLWRNRGKATDLTQAETTIQTEEL